MKTNATLFAILLATMLSGCGGGGGGGGGASALPQPYIFSYQTLYSGAALNEPKFMAFNGSELYVASNGNNQIVKFDTSTTNPTAAVVASFVKPFGIAFNNVGRLHASTNRAVGAGVYEISNGAATLVNGANCLTTNCYGLAFSSSNVLYWVDDDALKTTSNAFTVGTFLSGLAYGNNGVYATLYQQPQLIDAIQKITFSPTQSTSVLTTPNVTFDAQSVASANVGADGASGVAVDRNGNIYVANSLAKTIYKIAKSGSSVETFMDSSVNSGNLCKPVGLAIRGDSLYISDTCNGVPSIIRASIDLTH
jgi:hypothetical protein